MKLCHLATKLRILRGLRNFLHRLALILHAFPPSFVEACRLAFQELVHLVLEEEKELPVDIALRQCPETLGPFNTFFY
jgi:hypothetical protein